MKNQIVLYYVGMCLFTSISFTQNNNTWVEEDGEIYGAMPDENGLIGGGIGYLNIINEGDYIVEDPESLIFALLNAQPEEVIFIPGEIIIDLTTLIYIESFVLEIPEGVTLAGNRGHEGSKGAMISSDVLSTPVLISILGPNVRITGLRIQGPNNKRYLDHHTRSYGENGKGEKYYYEFPNSRGIETKHSYLEVDNCEISSFSHAGINLISGDEHHIHHNHIHHCQYSGLGYGINQDISSSLIEFNIFNWNRHSIAGTGRPGCNYVARHNIIGEISRGHSFDMHGGRDRGDGTNIAGTGIEIYNNTFLSQKTSVVIRGIPEKKCKIYNNWFTAQENKDAAVIVIEKSAVKNNYYGKVTF